MKIWTKWLINTILIIIYQSLTIVNLFRLGSGIGTSRVAVLLQLLEFLLVQSIGSVMIVAGYMKVVDHDPRRRHRHPAIMVVKLIDPAPTAAAGYASLDARNRDDQFASLVHPDSDNPHNGISQRANRVQ